MKLCAQVRCENEYFAVAGYNQRPITDHPGDGRCAQPSPTQLLPFEHTQSVCSPQYNGITATGAACWIDEETGQICSGVAI